MGLMRQGWLIALAAVVVIAVVSGGGQAALDRPLAAMVPGDVSAYSELNLDRMLGRAPETAALGEMFAGMRSPKLFEKMFAEMMEGEAEAEDVLKVLGMVKEASGALGPRIGWASWVPDASAMMGGMMGGMSGEGDPESAMAAAAAAMPKIVVVAEVRDGAALDGLVERIAAEANLPMRVTEAEGGARTTTFAEGMVELIRGEGWMALGFPPEQARKAADRASGTGEGSLWADPAYQGVMRRLPVDAVMTEYVSAQWAKQLLGIVNMMVPEAGFSYASEEPLGMAMGVRVETVQGRDMVTAYYTADMDILSHLADASLALQTVIMGPMIEKARASAQKSVCLSNVKNLSLAMQMYLVDYDDQFPEADGWVEALADYIGDESVLKCPEDDSEARCSYGMNAALSGRSVGELENPAEIVVFYETASPGDNPVGGAEDVVDPPRHPNGNSYGFADGHAAVSEEAPSFEVE